MNTIKSAAVAPGGTPTPEQLALINRQSKAELHPEQVYCFRVQLCDDQPDRDFERFDTAALPRLAELFLGKTGICDHEWSARQQLARIFDTQVETEAGVSRLLAWAYMLRDAQSAPVIERIEAGIHREVSIGCAMGQVRCSVCGERFGTCEHHKGESYGGKVCCGVLCDPQDAYEFSFVAVPAQPDARVRKAYGAQDTAVEKNAAMGLRYMDALRRESIRLALSLGLEVDRGILNAMAQALPEEQLLALNAALSALHARRYPCSTQLPGTTKEPFGVEAEFLI